MVFYLWLKSVNNAWLYLFLSQNKKERKKVRDVGILKKDPEQLKDQIQKLEVMSKLLHILKFVVCYLYI